MFTVINTYLNQTGEIRVELQDAAGRVVNLGAGEVEDLIADLQEALAQGEALRVGFESAAEAAE